MVEFNNFKGKTLKEIRLWAWAAAVLPLSALAGIFFIWAFGTGTLFNIAMIVGETTMFTIAVAWWWWALYVIRKLIKQWDDTHDNVGQVLKDIRDIKSIVNELDK